MTRPIPASCSSATISLVPATVPVPAPEPPKTCTVAPLDRDQGGEREPGDKASLDTTLASSPELAS